MLLDTTIRRHHMILPNATVPLFSLLLWMIDSQWDVILNVICHTHTALRNISVSRLNFIVNEYVTTCVKSFDSNFTHQNILHLSAIICQAFGVKRPQGWCCSLLPKVPPLLCSQLLFCSLFYHSSRKPTRLTVNNMCCCCYQMQCRQTMLIYCVLSASALPV